MRRYASVVGWGVDSGIMEKEKAYHVCVFRESGVLERRYGSETGIEIVMRFVSVRGDIGSEKE